MISTLTLSWFYNLVKESRHLYESIFPRVITSRSELCSYLNISQMTPRIEIKDQIPLFSFNKSILDPCWDIIDRGGKQWRTVLGLILSSMFIKDLQDIQKHASLYQLFYIVDTIHNASLIIDDIEDSSEKRRGKKCVHLIYGKDISINGGFAMMIFPMNQFLSKVASPIVKGIIAEQYFNEMSLIHLGQGWDIEMSCKSVPNIQVYIDTVLCKTGVCPRLIVKFLNTYLEHFLRIKTGTLFNELLGLCDDLSVGFQIWDDLMNIRPSTVSKGKNKIGEDITDGKLTMLILHSLKGNYKNSARLKEILQMKSKDQNIINEAIQILKVNNSIDYTEKKKNEYMNKFETKCKYLMNNSDYKKKYNMESLNCLIELKNNLMKV